MVTKQVKLNEILWALTDVDLTTGKVRVSKDMVRIIAEALKAGEAMRLAVYAHEIAKANDAWDSVIEGETN